MKTQSYSSSETYFANNFETPTSHYMFVTGNDDDEDDISTTNVSNKRKISNKIIL